MGVFRRKMRAAEMLHVWDMSDVTAPRSHMDFSQAFFGTVTVSEVNFVTIALFS